MEAAAAAKDQLRLGKYLMTSFAPYVLGSTFVMYVLIYYTIRTLPFEKSESMLNIGSLGKLSRSIWHKMRQQMAWNAQAALHLIGFCSWPQERLLLSDP